MRFWFESFAWWITAGKAKSQVKPFGSVQYLELSLFFKSSEVSLIETSKLARYRSTVLEKGLCREVVVSECFTLW